MSRDTGEDMRETPEKMQELQQTIEASARTAGPAIARNFIGGGWAMSATEFVEFWGDGRMASLSTASSAGSVHAVPLDLTLVDGKFYAPTFPNSIRLRDHRERARCCIVAWDDTYHAVIVYGTARESSAPPVAPNVVAEATASVRIEITPTRIYGIRPPTAQPAAG